MRQHFLPPPHSALTFSPCRQSENRGGNVVCSQADVGLWDNQSKGKVTIIEMPSAEIVLTGTHISVGYVPHGETTTVAVLDGEARVARVLDSSLGIRSLEPAFSIQCQEYWYGVNDNAFLLPGIGRRDGSRPLEQLPAVLKQATLNPVLYRITAQAWTDG